MKPLISIIIPAYNVEKYISKCIESINEQLFDNYEVIIVDDGSSDNTLEVARKKITDKFQILTQENMGAGLARNSGINLAKGKYITFMDADDFLYDKHCLEKIAEIVNQEKCDVVTYKMVRYFQNSGKFLVEDDITPENKVYSNICNYLETTIKNSRLSVSPCDKIIKTEIIKKNNIYFKKMAMLEDIDWSLELYKHVNSIMIYNEPIYVYRKGRTDSTTYSYTQQKILDCFNFVRKWCDECKNSEYWWSNLYLHYIAYQYTILIAAVDYKNCQRTTAKEMKEYSWLLEYNLNFKTKKASKVCKWIGYYGMTKVLKIYMYLKNKNLILIR